MIPLEQKPQGLQAWRFEIFGIECKVCRYSCLCLCGFQGYLFSKVVYEPVVMILRRLMVKFISPKQHGSQDTGKKVGYN